MTCENIYKDGADLALLAGVILLEMEKSSFLRTLCVLDEALLAVNNLSKIVQKENLVLCSLSTLVAATLNHLKDVAVQCTYLNKNIDFY